MNLRPGRRWCTFSLRALLLAMTLPALWFGYYHHWVAQRCAARQWVEAHHQQDFVCRHPGFIVDLPWPLRLVGESKESLLWVYRAQETSKDYRQAIEHLGRLFPEAQIFDGTAWHEPTLRRNALR